MKKLLLLAFVLITSATVYSQSLSTGTEPGTTTGTTDPAEINDPPVRDGDPMNPDPNPPVQSPCPDYCVKNISDCVIEIGIYYTSWRDCEGNIYTSNVYMKKVMILQPGEYKCFGTTTFVNGCCTGIEGNFHFGISAIGSQNIMRINRDGGIVPADVINCYQKIILRPTPGTYEPNLYTISNTTL